tara:strand:+ start:9174 stop:10532 length:1359 start_codon:yes stop_codon:yes gene_type:complete
MNYNNNDIIIAQSTPIGSSAIAVIRVSGKSLSDFVLQLNNKKHIKPRYNYKIEFKGFGSNKLIDTCVMVYYKAPKSFTGEDLLEVSCHGNSIIVEQIINEFIAQGVRLAYPGEFSYRAFKNNKIDLMQAESIAAKISANTDTYGAALQNMENGTVSQQLKKLKSVVLNTMTIIEHELDFNEDEITHLKTKKIITQFQTIKNDLALILARSNNIQKINQGYRVVIIGLPNAGKSTLFNKIIGHDRAIVTPIKGTTRDVLEATIKIKNIPFTFYDTAGYRKTDDMIEALGINKGFLALKGADIVLLVDETGPQKLLKTLVKDGFVAQGSQVVCVKTKCDAVSSVDVLKNKTLQISSKKNVGINQLLTHLFTCLDNGVEKNSSSNVVLCNERQLNLIKQGQLIIDEILKELGLGAPMDIISSECRSFVEIIEEMLGKISSEEVLNKIFKGFCVGK